MQPIGGIIKLMTAQGQIFQRIWLTQGIDRGDTWPDQKWDFAGTDKYGHEFDVQIQLTFEADETSEGLGDHLYIMRDGIYDEPPEM